MLSNFGFSQQLTQVDSTELYHTTTITPVVVNLFLLLRITSVVRSFLRSAMLPHISRSPTELFRAFYYIRLQLHGL